MGYYEVTTIPRGSTNVKITDNSHNFLGEFKFCSLYSILLLSIIKGREFQVYRVARILNLCLDVSWILKIYHEFWMYDYKWRKNANIEWIQSFFLMLFNAIKLILGVFFSIAREGKVPPQRRLVDRLARGPGGGGGEVQLCPNWERFRRANVFGAHQIGTLSHGEENLSESKTVTCHIKCHIFPIVCLHWKIFCSIKSQLHGI